MTDEKKNKAPQKVATTPAEGKRPEAPERRKGRERSRPLDRLGYLEDFLPSD